MIIKEKVKACFFPLTTAAAVWRRGSTGGSQEERFDGDLEADAAVE